MSANYYKIGSWNVICYICGKKRKREEIRKNWMGQLVCSISGCYDVKHPNEYPRRIIPDGRPVPETYPRPQAANWTYLPWPGTTTWSTAGLSWNNMTWRWDDDPSKNDNVDSNGNPIL